MHLSSPSKYYRAALEQQQTNLTALGYLVEINVPVHDLRAKLIPVVNLLSNTSCQTGYYCQWTLDYHNDEVRLLCRKEDTALWQRTLQDYSQ